MYKINDPEFIELITKGMPLAELEAKLRSDFSDEGFIGEKEDLLQLVCNDWNTVEAFKTTHQQIAQALRLLIQDQCQLNPDYEFSPIAVTCGHQDCPWECTEKYMKGESVYSLYKRGVAEEERFKRIMSVIESKHGIDYITDEIGVFSELHIHLIEKHYFFEGIGTPWRTSPTLLINALNLAQP